MSVENKFIKDHIMGYKLEFIMLFFGVVCSSFLGLLYPLITAEIVNEAIYKKSMNGLLKNFLLYIIIFIIHQLFHFIKIYFAAKLQNTFSVSVKEKLFEHIISLKCVNFSNVSSGDLMMRMGEDANQILNYIYYNVFYTMADIVEFFVQLIFIAIFSVPLFIFTLICMPFSFYMTRYFAKKSEIHYKNLKKERVVLSSGLFEIIQGMQEIRNLGGLNKMTHSFFKKNNRVNETQIKVNVNEMKNKQITQGISLGIHIGLYALSSYLIINGYLKFGTFLAIVEYFNASIVIFADIAGRGNPIANGKASINRIYEIYNLKREDITSGEDSFTIETADIDIKDCTFSYSDNKNVLDNCSLSIKAGEKIAIVGTNGSGKTTLVHMLIRLFDLKNGKIFIDGKDINNYCIYSLREQIGIVYQNVVLFDETLRYNIVFSDDSKYDEKIWEILRKIGMEKIVESLPYKLDTIIGKDGISFSGGQKQRLGIARVLMKDAKILIFDESTSALDSETEMLVRENWRSIGKDKTVIIIAHKLAIIQDMDRIVMMENGKIIGSGTHEILLSTCVQYSQLFKEQNATLSEGNIH